MSVLPGGVVAYKIWADLWHNKLRTLQVVLIIALGVFSVGFVVGGRELSTAVIDADWQAGDPPAMKLAVQPPLSEDDLLALARMDGISAVEGFQSQKIEWRHGPGEPWQIATLNARRDVQDQRMSRWELDAGMWPEQDGIAVERGYGPLHGLALGDTIQTRIDGRVRSMALTGVVNSHDTAPLTSQELVLYMDQRRYAEVTGSAAYNTVQAKLDAWTADGSFDPARADAIDAAVQERFDKLGIDSQGLIPVVPDIRRVASPTVNFAQGVTNSAFMLLGLVGALIIVMGGLMIYNTVSAVIAQQVGQIGMMKAIGARRRQVFRLYATLIVTYGLLAYAIAAPLGVLAANGLKMFFMSTLGIAGGGLGISMTALVLQLVVALAAPLLASLVPLLQGANITVREAISTFGLGGTANLLDRLLARLKHVSYTLLLMVGNTFRHRMRLVITQVALITGGVVFIAVLGARDATLYTLGPALTDIHRYQVTFTLVDDQRTSRLAQLALEQPGVAAVELWTTGSATVRPASRPEHAVTDLSATLYGLPLDTQMYAPRLTAGRWLQPGDEHTLTMHQELAARIGVSTGDRVTLRAPGGQETEWEIAGLFFDPATDTSIYVPQAVYAWDQKRINKTNTLMIRLEDPAPEAATAFARTLRSVLEQHHLDVATGTLLSANTVVEIADRRLSAYSVMIGLLLAMAVLVGLVGGIGLSGTLSLSVLERTREIGVMRAIGASSRRIGVLFVGEGLIQALLSWLLAAPLGVMGAHFITTTVLPMMFGNALLFRFSPVGLLLWLVVATLLAVAASWLPARRATHVSVRASLAYQ